MSNLEPQHDRPLRYLIVNADDFGLSRGVNLGILEAIDRGIVTSASLMVRQPAAGEAAASARANRKMSLGLHLDLGEWVYREGEWVQLYQVAPTGNAAAVRAEVQSQLAHFERLAGHPPSHLDSHQHVHRKEPVRSIMLQAARDLGVPLRECTPTIRYCGDFYGQEADGSPLPNGITIDGLKRTLVSLPEGVTEMGCHPGYGDDLQSVYRDERGLEVRTLCAPEIRQALSALHIQLCSFDQLPNLHGRPK
jgi:chitin disaccharide deacetylase